MNLLNIFCPECTPVLLLMLAGAWILGWLFWKIFKESGYKSSINKLEHEVEVTNKKNVDLTADIADARYEVSKGEAEITKLRTKVGDLDLKLKVQEEEATALNESYKKLQEAYDALKS